MLSNGARPATRIVRAATLVALLTAGACKKSSDALIVVTVTSAQTLSAVSALAVTVSPASDAGVAKPLSATYTAPGGSVEISVKGRTVGVSLPAAEGSVRVKVAALAADMTILATGTSGPVSLGAGQISDVTVMLDGVTPGPAADAGAGDGSTDGVVDAAVRSDLSVGQPDARGTSGAGGTATDAGGAGAGGTVATGGAGGGGAGGAPGSECGFDGEIDCVGMQPVMCANGYWLNQGPCPVPTTCTVGRCLCKGTVCGNACVAVQDDVHNCGACARECKYGACYQSVCQGVKIDTNQVTQVALDATNLYWLGGGKVWRSALDGTNPTPLATVAAIGLAVSAGDVYVGTSSTDPTYPNCVLKYAGGTGGPTTIAPNQSGARYILVLGSTVYWAAADDYKLMKATTTGANLTTILTTIMPTPARPNGIAVDANNIYWTSFGSQASDGRVEQVSLNNNDVGTPIALATGLEAPYGLVVDATSVYWADRSEFGGIYKIAIGGGTTTTLAQRQTSASGIALDGTTVYWGTNDSSLAKVSTAGGTPVVFPTIIGNPESLALNADSIYVVRDGVLYRFGKF